MTTTFDIITTHMVPLSNVVFTEDVIVGCRTSELSTNVVWQVNENEIYLHFVVTGALLEMTRYF